MFHTRRAAFGKGCLDGTPFLLVIVPFGLLFGVAATEAGLPLAQAMGFSVLVIAGAAQFTALQLMQDHAPVVIVLATSLAVNLRMAMYSAALAPYLGKAPLWQRALASYLLVDQSYALAHPFFQAHPGLTVDRRLAYFFGTMLVVTPFWYGATLAGALAGQAIPAGFALDFAVPITFLALIAPGLTTLPHVLAAGTSVVLALLLGFVPYSLGLIVAALVAMAVGAMAETRLEARR